MNEQDYLDSILAFDYGDIRIGVAIKPANEATPQPLVTVPNSTQVWRVIQELLDLHQPDLIIIGRPRNLDGEETEQTKKAMRFAEDLAERYNNKVELQDEALTTEQAKNRIPKALASKSRELIDQYAACVILEDYLKTRQN